MEVAELVAHLREAGVSECTLKFERALSVSYVPRSDLAEKLAANDAEDGRARPAHPSSEAQVLEDRFASTGIQPENVGELMKQMHLEREAARLERIDRERAENDQEQT